MEEGDITQDIHMQCEINLNLHDNQATTNEPNNEGRSDEEHE